MNFQAISCVKDFMREQDEEATVPPPDFSFDFAKTFQEFFKNTDLELY